MTEYYKTQLEAALEYQDFVSDVLRRDYGIYLGVYNSRKWQQSKGESASGIEIKMDTRFAKTGNLYIETAEKSNASLSDYVESGVRRNDGTWLYLIGDYSEAFLFSKRQLRDVCAQPDEYHRKKGIRRTQTPTSIGYLFPVQWVTCSTILLRHFDFRGKQR